MPDEKEDTKPQSTEPTKEKEKEKEVPTRPAPIKERWDVGAGLDDTPKGKTDAGPRPK